MPFLPRLSFAEKRKISVVNSAPQVGSFDNLKAVCTGVSTFKYPLHIEGVQHNEVIPGLFIGDGPLNAMRLNKIGAKRVLELGGAQNIKVTDSCRNPFKDDDIKFMSVKVEDSVDAKISCYFEECAKFIERGLKSGAVYVYSPGASRAGTIVAAFLMLRKGMSGCAALRAVHIRKPISPNDGFLSQLSQLEEDITRTRTRLCSHLEVSMECECFKKKPIYAPRIHYRDPKAYSMSNMGLNRQKVAQDMYFHCEDASVNPVTHTAKGAVKSIIFKVL